MRHQVATRQRCLHIWYCGHASKANGKLFFCFVYKKRFFIGKVESPEKIESPLFDVRSLLHEYILIFPCLSSLLRVIQAACHYVFDLVGSIWLFGSLGWRAKV